MDKYITLLINILVINVLSGCSNKPADEFRYDPNIVSIVWQLKQLPGYEIQENTMRLSFDYVNNRISGFTGCNTLTGSFNIRKGKPVLSPVAATRFMCPGKTELESGYLKTLSNTDSMILVNNELRLFSKSQLNAVFVKAQ